jgi:hypothetical protein
VKDLPIAPSPNKTTCWLLKGHRAKSKLETYGPPKRFDKEIGPKGETKNSPISQAEIDELFRRRQARASRQLFPWASLRSYRLDTTWDFLRHTRTQDIHEHAAHGLTHFWS